MELPDSLDGVFQPQRPFVVGENGELLVDHPGRLENLSPTYVFIEDCIGKTPRFARTNRSGDAIDDRQPCTPEMMKLVGNIYRQDIEAFRYD